MVGNQYITKLIRILLFEVINKPQGDGLLFLLKLV